MDERKGVDDDHEDIEKKVSIFHILNGPLAKTRNLISKIGFLVISWILRRWRIEWSFREWLCSILRANQDFL